MIEPARHPTSIAKRRSDCKVPRQMVTLGPALTLQNANRSSRSSSSSHFSRTDVTTFAPDSLAVAGTLFARGPLCRQDLARGIPKRPVHVRWNRNLRHNAQRVKVKEDGTCVMRVAATSNCGWNFDRARSADHRPYRFRANLGRGIRRLGDETTPAGASFDRRDQKPCLGVDGSGCHDFGAGTWAADLERQYFV